MWKNWSKSLLIIITQIFGFLPFFLIPSQQIISRNEERILKFDPGEPCGVRSLQFSLEMERNKNSLNV